MKTRKELENEIARMKQELEKVKELESGKLPDFLQNFDPKNIKKVLDFFEESENCVKYLKNATETQLKYGIDAHYFCYDTNNCLEFGDWIVTIVDQKGGGEGNGEHWHCVFKVEKHNELVGHFYIPGYYSSYNGTEIEWDDIYAVEPFEKMVIDWKRL